MTFYPKIIMNSFQFLTKKNKLIFMVAITTLAASETSSLLLIPFGKPNVFTDQKKDGKKMDQKKDDGSSKETVGPSECPHHIIIKR